MRLWPLRKRDRIDRLRQRGRRNQRDMVCMFPGCAKKPSHRGPHGPGREGQMRLFRRKRLRRELRVCRRKDCQLRRGHKGPHGGKAKQ
jgi:hypothetical protein